MSFCHCVCSHLKNLISTKPLGVWARMGCLYSCPQVKFYWNIVSYFAFLFLFAVVLMVDFQVMPSRWEFLLYIWLLTLVFEEVRQVREGMQLEHTHTHIYIFNRRTTLP